MAKSKKYGKGERQRRANEREAYRDRGCQHGDCREIAALILFQKRKAFRLCKKHAVEQGYCLTCARKRGPLENGICPACWLKAQLGLVEQEAVAT